MTRQAISCDGCEVEWPASARFCGWCGRPLGGTADGADPPTTAIPTGERGVSRIGRWSVVAGVVGIGVALIAAVTVGISSEWVLPQDDLDVTLPDGIERRSDRDAAENRPVASLTPLVSDGSSLACEPAGCARWEARIGVGDYVEADDVILQASATALRAVDPATGRTRWRVTYDEDGLPPVVDRPRVSLLGGDLAVITAADGLLQIRTTATGALLWHVDLEVDQIMKVAEHGDVIVVAGWPMRGRHHPPVRVAGFDRASGQLRWEHAVHRVVTLESDPLVVQPRNGVLLALDPATGQEGWTSSVIGPVRGLVGDGILAMVTATAIEVLDPTSGQRVRGVPRSVSDAGLTRLVGDLLIVDAPSGPEDALKKPRSDMTVVPLADATSKPLRFPDTTGIHPLVDGLLLVTQSGADITLHRLDRSGATVWSRDRAAATEACCWTVQASRSDDAAYLVPAEPGREPVLVIDLIDGATRTTFSVTSSQGGQPMVWVEGVAIENGTHRTVVSGPGGAITIDAHASLLRTDPWPVLMLEGGLLGLEPAQLGLGDLAYGDAS